MYLHFVDRRQQDRALAGGGGHNPVHSRGHDITNTVGARARAQSLAAFFLPSLLAAPTDDSSADQPTSARFWLAFSQFSCIQLNYWTSGNLWKRTH